MDKFAIRDAVVAQLEAELARQTQAAHSSRDEATDPDSRAEGKFDMRGQSAAYLAAGQAKLTGEISAALAAYRALDFRPSAPREAIAVGAVVTLESRGRRTAYFLGPARGGLDVEIDGVPVVVITAASFLGRSLLGQRPGHTLTVPGRGVPVAYTVTAVE
jgi:transcription elongation GreA/GreB family factor